MLLVVSLATSRTFHHMSRSAVKNNICGSLEKVKIILDDEWGAWYLWEKIFPKRENFFQSPYLFCARVKQKIIVYIQKQSKRVKIELKNVNGNRVASATGKLWKASASPSATSSAKFASTQWSFLSAATPKCNWFVSRTK